MWSLVDLYRSFRKNCIQVDFQKKGRPRSISSDLSICVFEWKRSIFNEPVARHVCNFRTCLLSVSYITFIERCSSVVPGQVSPIVDSVTLPCFFSLDYDQSRTSVATFCCPKREMGNLAVDLRTRGPPTSLHIARPKRFRALLLCWSPALTKCLPDPLLLYLLV